MHVGQCSAHMLTEALVCSYAHAHPFSKEIGETPRFLYIGTPEKGSSGTPEEGSPGSPSVSFNFQIHEIEPLFETNNWLHSTFQQVGVRFNMPFDSCLFAKSNPFIRIYIRISNVLHQSTMHIYIHSGLNDTSLDIIAFLSSHCDLHQSFEIYN